MPSWHCSPDRPNNTLAMEMAGGPAGLSPRAWDHRESLWDRAPATKAGRGQGRGAGGREQRVGAGGRGQGAGGRGRGWGAGGRVMGMLSH